MTQRTASLSVSELTNLIQAQEIDTVLVAMTDMQGRLQGKRVTGRYFLDQVMQEGTEGCSYILGVDVDMNTVDGYAITSWENGYGDFVFRPDLTTLRLIPWHPATAMVQCDMLTTDGKPVTQSPRQVLRRQLDRLAELGYEPMMATELEFNLYKTPYAELWQSRYADLEATSGYNIDYSLFGTGLVEPVLRQIRNQMDLAGLYTETGKGECNLGQLEVGFRYADALSTCDNHSVFKLGAKEIAAQADMSVTFMAKVNEREGNSCHIHMSLLDAAGAPAFPVPDSHDMSPVMQHFVAGQLAATRELTYLFAPNINSYKRFAKGSFAPTAVAWGYDNRSCSIRIVGHGPGLRFEQRVPGADVNQYLAAAALIAAGIHGIENQLELEPATTGNAYEMDIAHVPSTLAEAADLFNQSALAREAFGDEVVDHYSNTARIELEAFNAAVTDWERIRGFERL